MARFADETEPAVTVKPGIEMAEHSCDCTAPQQKHEVEPKLEKREAETDRICRVCKKQCDELIYRKATFNEGKCETDGVSNIIDYEDEEVCDEIIVVFKCPHCGALLFDDEDDAVDFLNG